MVPGYADVPTWTEPLSVDRAQVDVLYLLMLAIGTAGRLG